MRYLSAAMTFHSPIDPDAVAFDPTLDDDDLAPLTKHWPRLRDDSSPASDQVEAPVVLRQGFESWIVTPRPARTTR